MKARDSTLSAGADTCATFNFQLSTFNFMRTSLKFLHLADLHLDRSMSGGKLKLPFDKAEQRRRELREILGRAVETARSENVEVILIPGDFWEEEELSPETVLFVLERLGAAGVPVVIAPGNHDFHSPAGHYSNDIVHARFGKEWPKNVTIFRDYELTTIQIPGLDDVSITGLAYHSNLAVQGRKLAEKVARANASVHIALIHGSRDDNIPPGKMRTLPLSDAELLAQPFDYTALGHYHTRAHVTDSEGRIRAAYSGSTAALSVEDAGEHGALVGVAMPGGARPENLRFIELDNRRIHRVQLDVSGEPHVHAVEEKLAASLQNLEVRPEDMLFVELTGTYPQGNRIALGEEFVRGLCWHTRVDSSNVVQEWDLDAPDTLNPRTTEALFRSRIHKMMEDAADRGNDAEAKRLQNAMFYGLDALHGRSIAPRRT